MAARPASALAAIGLSPNKVRGQNFLVQTAVAERIVTMARLEPRDEVVEIGPGLGILTDRILERSVRRLHLVELEPKLAARLASRFERDSVVKVVEADFLALDLKRLIQSPPIKVLGNLPFGVAAAILRRLCDRRELIASMVLMFQREVAERIRAKPGEPAYGALSVFSSLYWEVDAHFRVGAGSFHPRPKVDAEVLAFVPRSKLPFKPADEPWVLELIRAGFSARRKTMRNALAAFLNLPAPVVETALVGAAISPGSRADTLAVEDFVRLAHTLAPNRKQPMQGPVSA